MGFMLTHCGIKANPEKCRAITKMRSLENTKEIQKLIDRLTVLLRFVPKLEQKRDRQGDQPVRTNSKHNCNKWQLKKLSTNQGSNPSNLKKSANADLLKIFS